MELLILRHAIAFPRDPKRWPDDGERPLTMEGMKRARRAAAGLKRIAKQPDFVLTSPLVRARDTAAIFAQAAHWPHAAECAALCPGGPPEEVLEILRRRGTKADCIAIVGHQPHLGRLLALCLRGDARCEAFELKKSAVVCVQFEGPPRARQGALTGLFPPRALRKI
ncbi:MAG TPA: phosphohistidine phosphatase SixA [Steroidobacteraceae bacterium]|nr:phosphohistidine phosphatase SixA [Steroidobacteraceae bacterium]